MKGHWFILAITDYFSKWDDAIPLIEVNTSNVVNFIKHHVIHQFGVPRRIIYDNGPQFVSLVFYWFCNKYQIQNVASTAYNPSLMIWQKYSIRRLLSYSRNSFRQANEIRMRNSVNVFGLTELQFEPQQVTRLFLWYAGVR